jgi:hypothetical protein
MHHGWELQSLEGSTVIICSVPGFGKRVTGLKAWRESFRGKGCWDWRVDRGAFGGSKGVEHGLFE